MDKSIEKIGTQTAIHRCPGAMPEPQKRFGLWICLVKNNMGSAFSYRETQPRQFEFYSLAQLLAGRARLWLESTGQEQEIEPGEFVLLPPRLVNRYGNTDSAFLEDALCFCGPAADALFDAGVIATGVYAADGERPLQSIIRLAANPAPNKQLQANIRLLELLARLTPAPQRRTERRLNRNRRLETLLNEITRNPGGCRTVEEMATRYGCGVEQFRIVFRDYTNMLPKEYIDQAKILRARQLLLNSAESIADIAARLEFHDQFHFSRVFKKKTGLPPSAFRALYQSDRSGETTG